MDSGKKSMVKKIIIILCTLSVRSLSGQAALELAGHWEGKGKISSEWCDQDSLYFHFMIDAEGEISGTIGDAMIIAGSIEKSASGYQYEITLKLKGPLISCEEIKRAKFVMDVNRDDNRMTGVFNTEGYIFGKKENGILQGTGLNLIYK